MLDANALGPFHSVQVHVGTYHIPVWLRPTSCIQFSHRSPSLLQFTALFVMQFRPLLI